MITVGTHCEITGPKQDREALVESFPSSFNSKLRCELVTVAYAIRDARGQCRERPANDRIHQRGSRKKVERV
jgi:hypothetical protein